MKIWSYDAVTGQLLCGAKLVAVLSTQTTVAERDRFGRMLADRLNVQAPRRKPKKEK